MRPAAMVCFLQNWMPANLEYFSFLLLHSVPLNSDIGFFPLSSGDKLVRATELVKLLALEKSVKGAIKLVTALKLPNLAERFNAILEVGILTSMEADECCIFVTKHSF